MSATTTLTALTLNCWGLKYISKKRRQRMEAIADALAHSDYELVCLQEVWVYNDFELIRDRTKKRFPYNKFFHSGILGGGLVIISRYPILEIFHHPYRLNGRPQRFTHGDWYVGKGVGSALIDHPIAGFIEVFTTHTHAGYGSRKNDQYLGHRASQAWEIANLLKNSAARGRNVIALGDFNNDHESLLYKVITHHGQMTDAWLSQHPSTPASMSTTSVNQVNLFDPETAITQKGVTSNSPINTWSGRSARDAERDRDAGQRIDFIFYRKTSRFWCSGSRVVFTETIPELNCSYSDHFGVEATFTVVGRDKNAVIPLSIWEQSAYESLQELEPRTYQSLIDLFRQDLNKTKCRSRFYLVLFWITVLLVLAGIIVEALIAGNALDSPSWVNVIILIAMVLVSALGVIFGLIRFLFGSYEQKALTHAIEEVQSYVKGKKVFDSKRVSSATNDDNLGSESSQDRLDVKDTLVQITSK